MPPQDAKSRQRHEHIFGKPLFAEKATWRMLQRAHDSGFVAKGSGLSEQFDFAAWQKEYGPSALPMFTISEEGKLKIISASDQPQPEAGETLLALVRENEERELAKEGAKVAKSAANSG